MLTRRASSVEKPVEAATRLISPTHTQASRLSFSEAHLPIAFGANSAPLKPKAPVPTTSAPQVRRPRGAAPKGMCWVDDLGWVPSHTHKTVPAKRKSSCRRRTKTAVNTQLQSSRALPQRQEQRQLQPAHPHVAAVLLQSGITACEMRAIEALCNLSTFSLASAMTGTIAQAETGVPAGIARKLESDPMNSEAVQAGLDALAGAAKNLEPYPMEGTVVAQARTTIHVGAAEKLESDPMQSTVVQAARATMAGLAQTVGSNSRDSTVVRTGTAAHITKGTVVRAVTAMHVTGTAKKLEPNSMHAMVVLAGAVRQEGLVERPRLCVTAEAVNAPYNQYNCVTACPEQSSVLCKRLHNQYDSSNSLDESHEVRKRARPVSYGRMEPAQERHPFAHIPFAQIVVPIH